LPTFISQSGLKENSEVIGHCSYLRPKSWASNTITPLFDFLPRGCQKVFAKKLAILCHTPGASPLYSAKMKTEFEDLLAACLYQ
jgi:hypothetical protein